MTEDFENLIFTGNILLRRDKFVAVLMMGKIIPAQVIPAKSYAMQSCPSCLQCFLLLI